MLICAPGAEDGRVNKVVGTIIGNLIAYKRIHKFNWIFCPQYGGWEAEFPVKFGPHEGTWTIWIQPRPYYCDRGRWCVGINAKGVPHPDEQEGYPRYFFNLDYAKSEMEEWVKVRKEVMQCT